MIVSIKNNGILHEIDINDPLDISIPVRGSSANVSAWGSGLPRIQPYSTEDFTVAVAQGASVNFNDVEFNPHSHCTHTECYGHITKTVHSVNRLKIPGLMYSKLVTIAPEKYQDDFVISRKQLRYTLGEGNYEAVIIRTLPNTRQKLSRDYSGMNPPYLLEETASFLADQGVSHLLVDLPSVDKENDSGALLAHRAFWRMDETPRTSATITELIYVGNKIKDGVYYLNLQLGPFDNDAAPSRPLLYKIIQ